MRGLGGLELAIVVFQGLFVPVPGNAQPLHRKARRSCVGGPLLVGLPKRFP